MAKLRLRRGLMAFILLVSRPRPGWKGDRLRVLKQSELSLSSPACPLPNPLLSSLSSVQMTSLSSVNLAKDIDESEVSLHLADQSQGEACTDSGECGKGFSN